MSLYHYFSLGKIILGLSILVSLYLLINPFSDPLIALSGTMIGLFLFTRGLSFFMFIGRGRYVRKSPTTLELFSHSHKLSLLFGIYILFNVIFFFSKSRDIGVGVVLLIAFIVLQSFVLESPSSSQTK